MKYKYLCTAGLSFLMLALFLPVFSCVIFIGNRMDYDADNKITTLFSNPELLLFGMLAAVLILTLCIFMRKIPFNRYTAAGMVIGTFVFCVLFYALNIKISKCIAFYSGWDCGMVANSAKQVFNGGEMGYGDYYTIFTNNVPITWLLYKLYGISNAIPGYPYNYEFIWIQFQCAMYAAAVFFAVMTVLLITRKIAPSVLTLLISATLIGLSPWKIIPYTDASTIAIPVFVIFLYALFLHMKTKLKYAVWMLMVLAGLFGGLLKATCYVALIAIVAVDFVWLLFHKITAVEKLKGFGARIVLLVCGYMAITFCKNGMYETLKYEYDYDTAITWTNFLYDGLSEESTGGSSGDGFVIIQSYKGLPRYIRDMVERKYIKDRIVEKGFWGLMYFWLRKSVMNFNDGTFSWYGEGWFNAYEYDDIIESGWKEPLREFYWEEGGNYIVFATLSQGVWLFVLLGIVIEGLSLLWGSVEALERKSLSGEIDSVGMRVRVTGIVFFIGVFLFVMLFEGRARYLFNNISVFTVISAMGYYRLAEKLINCRADRAKRKILSGGKSEHKK